MSRKKYWKQEEGLQGRDTFSRKEIEKLKELLERKARADPDEQKKIRQQMRRMDFYISDFDPTGRGFLAADLEDLVRNGTIKVTD